MVRKRKSKSEKSKPPELSPGNEGGKEKQLGVMETACVLRYSYSLLGVFLTPSAQQGTHKRRGVRFFPDPASHIPHLLAETDSEKVSWRRWEPTEMSLCKPRGLSAFHINPLVLKKRSILPCTFTCLASLLTAFGRDAPESFQMAQAQPESRIEAALSIVSSLPRGIYVCPAP